MKNVQIYTDGACKGNPGPGGWGAIIVYGSVERELSGGEERTTNNRMELSGAIAGLAALKERCHVTLYSDSKYLIDALQKGWAVGWRARGWKKSDGKPALNPDLWERLLGLMERHEVETVWVMPITSAATHLPLPQRRRVKSIENSIAWRCCCCGNDGSIAVDVQRIPVFYRL